MCFFFLPTYHQHPDTDISVNVKSGFAVYTHVTQCVNIENALHTV